MGLITYALLVVGGWYAIYLREVEHIREGIAEKRKAYSERPNWSRMTNPDLDKYPWGKLIGMSSIAGFICMVIAIPLAICWKLTWIVAILLALYFKVKGFRAKADSAWASIKSWKASVEAKLRG